MTCLLLSFAAALAAPSASLVDRDVFAGGTDGYFCYRLPNLVQLKTPGHLLAVAQGHKYDCFDGGWMDVVAKTSNDNGRTWSAQHLVYSLSAVGVRNVTIGTPSAVADLKTGAVHLFVSVNFESIMLFRSNDSGLTWGAPRNMTTSLIPAGWGAVFTGLPQGIQLDSGRLLICANHKLPSTESLAPTKSYTIYSDDHGATWHNGADVGPQHMGECSVSQGATGVFLYARVWWDDYFNSSAPTWTNSTRGLAFSKDGGATFGPGNLTAFPNNPMRDVQGAMIVAGAKRDTFVVGGPWGYDHWPRLNYTVLVSHAGADGMPTTWAPLPGADPLWSNTSAYSSLLWPSAEPDTFFVLYERGGQFTCPNPPHGKNHCVPPGGLVGDAVLHLKQLKLPSW